MYHPFSEGDTKHSKIVAFVISLNNFYNREISVWNWKARLDGHAQKAPSRSLCWWIYSYSRPAVKLEVAWIWMKSDLFIGKALWIDRLEKWFGALHLLMQRKAMKFAFS